MNILKSCAILLTIFLLAVFSLTGASNDESQGYFKQAQQLYDTEGEPKAQEITKLLLKSVEADPENKQAVALLGVTYFGIGDFENAIEQFDRYITLGNGSINPQIYLKKAVALHNLGRHNESRRILATMWAFFQDPQEHGTELDAFYAEVVDNAREQNFREAYRIFAANGADNLQDFLYFPIDEDNYLIVKEDSDISPLTHPLIGRSHGWMDIVAIPMHIGDSPSYGINFDWGTPVGFSLLEPRKSDSVSIDELKKLVQWHEVDFDSLNAVSISYQMIEVTTDSGESLTGFQILPAEEGN